MNEHEKLIEEAAKAIYNGDPAWGYVYEDDHGEHGAPWDHLGSDLHEKFRSLAKGALAVFEKAHAPTDEEREAARRLLGDVNPKYGSAPTSMLAEDIRAVVIATLRRPDAPERSVKERECAHGHGVVAEESEWESESIQYGHVLNGGIFIVEPRGRNYSTYQRLIKLGIPASSWGPSVKQEGVSE